MFRSIYKNIENLDNLFTNNQTDEIVSTFPSSTSVALSSINFASKPIDNGLIGYFHFAKKENKSIQIIGSGTNAIFPEYFSDVVIRSTNNDFTLDDAGDRVSLSVGAAVVWDDLIDFCVNKGLFGLGNLAGIPGTVGAAPVQNIGAYGEEISNFISSNYKN